MKKMKKFLTMLIAAAMIVTSLPLDSVSLKVQAKESDNIMMEASVSGNSVSGNDGTGEESTGQTGNEGSQDDADAGTTGSGYLYKVMTMSEEEYHKIKADPGLIWGYQNESGELISSIFEGREWDLVEPGDNSKDLNETLAGLQGYAAIDLGSSLSLPEGLVIPEALEGVMFLGNNYESQVHEVHEINSILFQGNKSEVILKDCEIALSENTESAFSFKVLFQQNEGEDRSNAVFWNCKIRGALAAETVGEDSKQDGVPSGSITLKEIIDLTGYEAPVVTEVDNWAQLRIRKPGKLVLHEIRGNGRLDLIFDGYDPSNLPSFDGEIVKTYDEGSQQEVSASVFLIFYKSAVNEAQQEVPIWDMDDEWTTHAEDVDLKAGDKVADILSDKHAADIVNALYYLKSGQEEGKTLTINRAGYLIHSLRSGFDFKVISVTEEEYRAIMEDWSVLYGEGEGEDYQPSVFNDRWIEYEGVDINSCLSSMDASYVIVELGMDIQGTLSIPSRIMRITFLGGWNYKEERENVQMLDAIKIAGTSTEVNFYEFNIEASDADVSGNAVSDKFTVGFAAGENDSSMMFWDCTVHKVISAALLTGTGEIVATEDPVGTVRFKQSNRIVGYEGVKVTVHEKFGELLLDAPGSLHFYEIAGQGIFNIVVNGYDPDLVPGFSGPIDLGTGYDDAGNAYDNQVCIRYLVAMEEPAWNTPYEEDDLPWPERVEDEPLSSGARILSLETQDPELRADILQHCAYNRFWKENEEWLGIDKDGCLAGSWQLQSVFSAVALTEEEYTEVTDNWALLWGHEDEDGNYIPSKFEKENRWVDADSMTELLDTLKDSEYIILMSNKDYTEETLVIPETLKEIYFIAGWNQQEQRTVHSNINGITIQGKDTKVYLSSMVVPDGESHELKIGFQPEGNAELILDSVRFARTLVAYSLGAEKEHVGRVQIKSGVELNGYAGVETTYVEQYGFLCVPDADRLIFKDVLGNGELDLIYNGYDVTKVPVINGKVDLGSVYNEVTGEDQLNRLSIRYLKEQKEPAWSEEDWWQQPLDVILEKGAKVVDFGQQSAEEITRWIGGVKYRTCVGKYMGYFIDETGRLTYDSNNMCRIYFNTAGGSEIEPMQLVCGGYPEVEEPVRDGYLFDGWYCDPECQIPYEKWEIYSDTTFYAKWKTAPNSQGIRVEGVTSHTYTGKKITPVVSVYDGEQKLIQGKDYTVKYKNNINASAILTELGVDKTGYDPDKQPTIQITGKGNYTLSYEIPFEIYAKDLCGENMAINMVDAYVMPKKGDVKIVLTVKNGKTTLKKGKDYEVEYFDESGNNLSLSEINEEEDYTLRIIGKSGSNYTGTEERTFTLTASRTPLCKAKVSISSKAKKQAYTGMEIMLPSDALTVKVAGRILTEGTDYRLEYENNIEVGKAKVYIRSAESQDCKYCGSTFAEFEITGTPIGKTIIENFRPALFYTGGEVFQDEMTLWTKDHERLIQDRDYYVEYSKNQDAGNATAIIHGIGRYTGSVKKQFKIKPVSLDKNMCRDAEIDAVFTATGAKPDITLYYNNMRLENGKDYTLIYSNNKKVAGSGDAKAPSITVKGKGNYCGTVKEIKKFTIYPQSLEGQNITVQDMVFAANQKDSFAYKPAVTVYDNGKKISSKNYSVQFTGNTQSDIKETLSSGQPAEAKVIVTMTDKNGFYTGTQELSFYITPLSLKKAKLVSVIPEQSYTGEAVTLEPGVLQVKDAAGTLLTEGVDFEIVSYSANVKTTKAAKVTIKGIGKYSGTATFQFKILSKKMK